MLIHSAVITGSVQFNNTDVSGITNVSSFATTSSVNSLVVRTGSYASTSSVNDLQSKTGSYATTSSVNELQSKTGSYTSTSSFGTYTASNDTTNTTQNTRLSTIESKTGSYATTSSNQFNGDQIITGSLTATNTITAQTLIVQTITSSVDFITGSTRNGSLLTNTHQFTGSVLMSGSVGIGTTSPIALLTVAQVTANMTASRSQIAITTGGNYGNVIGSGVEKYLDLSFYGFTNAEVARIRSWDESNVTLNGSLTFWTLPAGGSVTERMRITSTGNVVIGGTTAQNNSTNRGNLTINGTTSILNLSISDTNAGYLIHGGTDLILVNAKNGAMLFYTNDTERMRITSGGWTKISNDGTYVSIAGTVHEIKTTLANQNIIYLVNTSNTSPYGPYIEFPNAAPNNATNYFLGCGDSAATRFHFRSNGGLANYAANDVNLSDIRTKKDIVPLGSYWDKFKAIEIVKFKYKDQSHDDYNIGVISQQVESVAPEFVDIDGFGTTPEDGIPLKAIYTADLYHATIKVLQEAMIKIEKLSAENTSLINRIEALENK